MLNPIERAPAAAEEGDGDANASDITELRGTIRRLQKEIKELNLENDDYEHR